MKASLSILSLLSISAIAQKIEVSVKNDLDFDRKEIVSVPVSKLAKIMKPNLDHAHVAKKGQTEELLVQWVDFDGDGEPEELLFQAEVPAKSKSEYTIFWDGSYLSDPRTEVSTYSRFVPERTDDYAWENDKVAFRTYGPDAQQRAEQKRENGTLSSGIDLWLKRTSKPVINDWYAGYKTDPMFYHSDHGDGYDPYHVGASRGTGGTGVWANDTLYVSKNFVSWKTIARGPLRTIFELYYAPYSPSGVAETKRISLDLGSNFSKFEIGIKSESKISNYALGITLHKNEGEPKIDKPKGILRHYEKIDDAFVGEGIVMNPKDLADAFVHKSATPDQSNLIATTLAQTKLVYYAGFAWTKSGQINNVADWDKMLERQAQIISKPLQVTVK